MADREQLLAIVRRECALRLAWTGPDCAAEKYCAALRPQMRARGHRAENGVRFSW
ncbi:hypothetical protein JW859_06365 [bacterium]|nr:hypothetical protein [bacterium]